MGEVEDGAGHSADFGDEESDCSEEPTNAVKDSTVGKLVEGIEDEAGHLGEDGGGRLLDDVFQT